MCLCDVNTVYLMLKFSGEDEMEVVDVHVLLTLSNMFLHL